MTPMLILAEKEKKKLKKQVRPWVLSGQRQKDIFNASEVGHEGESFGCWVESNSWSRKQLCSVSTVSWCLVTRVCIVATGRVLGSGLKCDLSFLLRWSMSVRWLR